MDVKWHVIETKLSECTVCDVLESILESEGNSFKNGCSSLANFGHMVPIYGNQNLYVMPD